jgi:hypothetical protein
MNTFLKVLLVIAICGLVAHFFPLLLVPFALLGLLLLGAFGVAFTLAGTGVLIFGVLLAVFVSLLTALSPLWIPVVAVLAVISLCRRSEARTA